MCLLYTFSLPQYFGHYNITCGVINRVLTWDDIHSVIPPSHSSHRRPALTLPMDTHHTRPSPGGKLFVCVHLFHYRDKRVLPESGQERESIYLLLTTFSSSEWPSNCYSSHLDPVLQRMNIAVSVKLFV